jgi:hypothetical protein
LLVVAVEVARSQEGSIFIIFGKKEEKQAEENK